MHNKMITSKPYTLTLFFAAVGIFLMTGCKPASSPASTTAVPANAPAVAMSAAPFTPPASPCATFNFNPGWKFIRQDVTNAQQVDFDDSQWTDVSAPHTYNDTDSYAHIISHSGGDREPGRASPGIASISSCRRAPRTGRSFSNLRVSNKPAVFGSMGNSPANMKMASRPLGLDLTGFVNFGDAENVIAVKVDNSNDYREEATGVPFEWMGRAFNPNYGGLNHDIWLHLTGKVYQTLPLYENLKTTGIYIYPSDFDISGKTCNVNVESQVRMNPATSNPSRSSAVVVDAAGQDLRQI